MLFDEATGRFERVPANMNQLPANMNKDPTDLEIINKERQNNNFGEFFFSFSLHGLKFGAKL